MEGSIIDVSLVIISQMCNAEIFLVNMTNVDGYMRYKVLHFPCKVMMGLSNGQTWVERDLFGTTADARKILKELHSQEAK